MAKSGKNPISSGKKGRAWAVAAIIVAIIVASIIAIVAMRPTSPERLSKEVDFGRFEGIEVEFVEKGSEDDKPGTLIFQREGGAEENAGVANLAEDPYCSHCADMNKASSEAVLSKVKDGKLVMRIHLASVTDNNANDYGPSRTAMAAIAAAARAGDASSAWGLLETNYHKGDKTYMMNLSDYKDFLESVTDNEKTIEYISDEEARYDDAKMMWEETHSYLKENVGEVSTPTLLDKNNKKVEYVDIRSDDWVYEMSAP